MAPIYKGKANAQEALDGVKEQKIRMISLQSTVDHSSETSKDAWLKDYGNLIANNCAEYAEISDGFTTQGLPVVIASRMG